MECGRQFRSEDAGAATDACDEGDGRVDPLPMQFEPLLEDWGPHGASAQTADQQWADGVVQGSHVAVSGVSALLRAPPEPFDWTASTAASLAAAAAATTTLLAATPVASTSLDPWRDVPDQLGRFLALALERMERTPKITMDQGTQTDEEPLPQRMRRKRALDIGMTMEELAEERLKRKRRKRAAQGYDALDALYQANRSPRQR